MTKGKKYGLVYNWAIDVSVPGNWTRRKDERYATQELGLTTDELTDRILFEIENFKGVLDFALCFLTGHPYDPDTCVFRQLPPATKVEMLANFFRQRSTDAGYRERFDCDLRRFVETESICMPIVGQYFLDPKSVWVRQAAAASEVICATTSDFSESLACENEDCPSFVSVNRIDLPPRRADA